MDKICDLTVLEMSFDTLRRVNVERCEAVFHRLDAWSPADWAVALGGEVGEALNEVKKLRRLDDSTGPNDHRTKQEIIQAIANELADTVIYADLLAARLKIDLGRAIVGKFNEVSRRRGYNVRIVIEE